MGDFSLKMTGDWNRAGLKLSTLSVKLHHSFEAQLMEDGQFVLKKMRDHIDKQDLGWTPLSERTVKKVR